MIHFLVGLLQIADVTFTGIATAALRTEGDDAQIAIVINPLGLWNVLITEVISDSH